MAIVANIKQVLLVMLGTIGDGEADLNGLAIWKAVGVLATVAGSLGFVVEGEKKRRAVVDSNERVMEEGRAQAR